MSLLSTSNQLRIAGMMILAGLILFFIKEDVWISVIGGIVFLVGLNFFIDAKIEEAKK